MTDIQGPTIPKTWWVYQLTFPDGRRYIGMASDLQRRFREHRRAAAAGKQSPLYSALRHIGLPKACKLGVYETRDDALEAETRFIEERGTLFPAGYNRAISSRAAERRYYEEEFSRLERRRYLAIRRHEIDGRWCDNPKANILVIRANTSVGE